MKKNKLIYLVTGCAGFVGYHVCKLLLKKNIEVIGIDNINNYYDVHLKLERLKELKKIKGNFSFYKINITNYKKLDKIFSKLENFKVIHLAAQAGIRYSLKNPKTYIQSNLLGFWNVLDLSKKYKSEHIVFASSSSIYGDNKKIPFKENDNTDRPIQLYAATKKSNEVLAYSYSSLYNLKLTGLRFFTVYGPWGRPDMAIYKFTKSILKNKTIKVNNNGNHYRDFTYVEDVAKGIFSIVSNKKKINTKNYEIYNLGNGRPVHLKRMITILEKLLSKKAQIKYLPLQKGDMIKTYSDTSKFNKAFPMKFVPLKNGLVKFLKWFTYYYGR